MNAVKCKNYANLGYEHYILESKSINQRVFDRLQICAVCSSRAFQDNNSANISQNMHKAEKNITFIGNDTL